jgi:hypothetical protein
MFKSAFLTSFLCLLLLGANAQTLTLPPEIAAAYAKGTRSANGKPGKNYWQNHGRYTIAVSMAPPDKTITGAEQITYFNNSPDTLSSLNMKLIVNVHRAPGRGGAAGNPALGIVVDQIQVNGAKANWDNAAATTTNYMMGLAKPLMPHDSVKMDINWHYQLAAGRGRDGAIDSTTFYLAYFYPRVSVYDDYKGWDTQPHTGGLEFYNDFNDYTLSVTVPKNYIVWATGTLQNPTEVLQPDAAKKLAESMVGDSTVHIATVQDLAAKNITAQNTTNTWKWACTNISDVALAVSNHYDWDAASVLVDDKAKRRVSVQAAFADASNDFHHYVQFARNSLDWFSHNLPGVPYPFPKTTSVQGFADMEYPMMVNDSHTNDLTFAQLVQDHEIAHTYMPFYMGTNESRYAFMDEGWATTWELLIGTAEHGKKIADDFYKKFRIVGWNGSNHKNELPIITPSPEVTTGAGNNAYNKPSLSYLAVKDLLGDKLFTKALHTYMDNWHGKHPIPWDYFNSMSAGAGKNLDWFFYNWFYTKYWVDISLESAEKTGSGYTLAVKNIGGFASPFDVVVNYADGTSDSFHLTPAVWEKDQTATTVKIKTSKEVKDITLDGGVFMDADPKNNTWTAK